MTTNQLLDESKDVTRRLGWWFLIPADRLWGVKKSMGLKKGEKIQRLKFIEVITATPEPLNTITQDDVIREGFPEWTPEQFVGIFVAHNKIKPDVIINRIEFKYLPMKATS